MTPQPDRAAGARSRSAAGAALLCPSCQSPVAAGERFCEACGADLGLHRPCRRRAEAEAPPRWRTAALPRRATSAAARSPTTATARSAGPRPPARATTSPSSRRRGSRPSATAASATSATRMPWPSPPGPSRQPRGAGRLRRGLLVDRLRRRQPGRRPGRARRPGALPAPRRTGTVGTRRGGEHEGPRGGGRRGQRRGGRPHDRRPGQPGLVHLRRRRPRRATSSPWAGSATAGPTGCPTSATPRLLTVDDSFAAEQIADGVPRADAESGPQAHAITRWLGIDAPDHTPRTVSLDLDRPGVAARLLRRAVELLLRGAATSPAWWQRRPRSAGAEPLALAGALVDWANAQGGQDNITVALARVGAEPPDATAGTAQPIAASSPQPVPSREEVQTDGNILS